MTTITVFDKSNLNSLAVELKAACAVVAAKHGLKAGSTRCNYDAASVRFSIDIEVQSTEGKKAVWDKNCGLLNLKPEHFGREFQSNGRTFRIIGINVRSSAKPVIAESDGKEYVFRADAIRAKFGCQYAFEANKQGVAS